MTTPAAEDPTPPSEGRGAGDSRRGLAAAIAVTVLVAVTLPLALLGGSGDDADSRLLVELRGGELLVTVPDLTDEQPDDPTAVRLRCDDAAGKEVVSAPVQWPLDTDAGRLEPHIHLPVDTRTGDRIATCSLVGLSREYKGTARG